MGRAVADMYTEIEPLLRLAVGASRIGLKKSALETEIRAGRLTPIVVAGRRYVTATMLREFVESCRAAPKARASISGGAPAAPLNGSSATESARLARDAALATARGLKERSRAT